MARRALNRPRQLRAEVMRTWLRSLVDAILGRVPNKTGLPDTATRMAMDADLSYRGELSRPLPERDDQHLFKFSDPLADINLLEVVIRSSTKRKSTMPKTNAGCMIRCFAIGLCLSKASDPIETPINRSGTALSANLLLISEEAAPDFGMMSPLVTE